MEFFPTTKLAVLLSDFAEILEENSFVKRAFLADLKNASSDDSSTQKLLNSLRNCLGSAGKYQWRDFKTILSQAVLEPESTSVTEWLKRLSDVCD